MTALRYILLASRLEGSRRALAAGCERATGFDRAAVGGPFEVLTNQPEQVIALPGGGAVIGQVFERYGWPRAVDAIADADLAELLRGEEARLIGRYWGGYVAAVEGLRGMRVVRAPMGALPCYFTSKGGVHAFASDLGLLEQAGLVRPRIDWRALDRYLLYRDLPASETVIVKLRELLPGTAIAIDEGATRSVWSPWDHVSPEGRREEAAERLERVVRNCVSAMASGDARILLALSGGLDSSIVASCLAARSSSLHCLTVATTDPSGDERDYARIAAGHVGARLVERLYDPDAVDLSVSVAAHLPRPCGRIHEQAFHDAAHSVAGELGCEAFYTGNGGDNVFYNSSSARPVLDRLLAEGPGGGVCRTIGDVGAITGASHARVAGEAARIWRGSRRGYRWRPEARFLSAETIERAGRCAPEHPWLRSPKDALPGKAAHIAMLLRMQHHLESFDRAGPLSVINPLTAQPIVEACLAIPTWRMCEGGLNRAPARAAFSSKLPHSLLARRSKAGPDAFILQLMDRKAPKVRERLMEGRLARRGVLDRDALDHGLSPVARQDGTTYMRLMALLDTESWLDRWDGRGQGG